MATPQVTQTIQPLTGDVIIDMMTTGYRWLLNADRTIDWSISGGFNGEFWTDPAGTAAHLQQALDFVSYYANVRFNYLGSYSTPTAAAFGGAEINLTSDGSNRFFSSNNIWAKGFFPSAESNSTLYPGAAGDIYLNINSDANHLPSYDLGSPGFALILHELGHALGLKHPHDSGGTGRPTFDQVGLDDFDEQFMSVMSYNDDYSWNLFGYHAASYMALDVLALQYMYGKNMLTNAGDSLFNLSAVNAFITIWDASGIDTLSFAGSAKAFDIQLPDFQFSFLVDTLIGAALPTDEEDLDTPHSLFWLMGDLENVTGSAFGDTITGNRLNNTIMAGGGNDTVDGGGGTNYLRGDDGNDSIVGGAGFNDINGNMGNDTVDAGAGDSWAVGGKDNDSLVGGAGQNLVYGNIGNDTCDGGAGNDIVRGGQDNDLVAGGAGNDFVSGDKGSDTMTGGAGADVFHTFGDAGIDRVTDFHLSEGDRVQLDPGTVFTVSQSGADTLINMTGGGQMILVGVQMSTLTPGWIFGA